MKVTKWDSLILPYMRVIKYNATRRNVRVKETTKTKIARNEPRRNDIVNNQGGANALPILAIFIACEYTAYSYSKNTKSTGYFFFCLFEHFSIFNLTQHLYCFPFKFILYHSCAISF